MDIETKIDLIFIGIILALLFILKMVIDSGWNNGYCSCGGKWVYQQAIGHRYETVYLYECNKCGKTIEFFEKY